MEDGGRLKADPGENLPWKKGIAFWRTGVVFLQGSWHMRLSFLSLSD
jgi:hypothetical protein